jgi:predicted DNA-binding protein with PD1-like motif
VAGQVEVLSLIGDVAVKGSEPAMHAHVVMGLRNGSTGSGDICSAPSSGRHSRVIVTETPAHLRKRIDEKTGLALIALDSSG